MKVGEFVNALQSLPQDAELSFTVGYSDYYREACAHAIIDEKVPDFALRRILEDMTPAEINAKCLCYSKDNFVTVILEEDRYDGEDLDNTFNRFLHDYIESVHHEKQRRVKYGK